MLYNVVKVWNYILYREVMMSRDITEKIDDICKSEYGHTNWAFADTLTEKELKEVKNKKLGDKMPNLFHPIER